MLRKLVTIFFIALPILSFANKPTLNDVLIQNNQCVGKVEFKKWFFDVYDAELLTQNGRFSWEQPFVLKIHYLMNFKSKTIANSAISEISKQHKVEVRENKTKYSEIIDSVIPNIKKNSDLYGYMDKDGYAYIFTRDKLVGKIKDKQLSRYFFEIWLSDKTSHHIMSTKLRGIK